ncbi:MAG: hypothetical protein OWQ57_04905 [Sulfobacillus sp.]|nr:hypothetical protein [Sulfobacillus sp.]
MPSMNASWLTSCDVKDIMAPVRAHPIPQNARVHRVYRVDNPDCSAPFNAVEEYCIGAMLHCAPWTPQFFNDFRDPSVTEQLARLYELMSEGRVWWQEDLIIGLEIHRFSGQVNQTFLSSLMQHRVSPVVEELVSPLSAWFPPPYSAYKVSDQIPSRFMSHDLRSICNFLEKTQDGAVTLRVGRWDLLHTDTPPKAIQMLRSRYRTVGLLTHPSSGIPIAVNAFDG